mgnify:FL=1
MRSTVVRSDERSNVEMSFASLVSESWLSGDSGESGSILMLSQPPLTSPVSIPDKIVLVAGD